MDFINLSFIIEKCFNGDGRTDRYKIRKFVDSIFVQKKFRKNKSIFTSFLINMRYYQFIKNAQKMFVPLF